MVRANLVVVAGLGLALALSACGSKEDKAGDAAASSEEGASKSVGELQAEAGKLERPEPGKYKQTVEILQMEMPGLPKEAQDQMARMQPKTQVSEICLTEKDTEQGFKDMFKDLGKGGDCTYDKFNVSGGSLDARMTCQIPQQGKAVMTVNGAASKTGSDVTVAMDMSGGPSPMGNMKMKMHMTTERIGDCTS